VFAALGLFVRESFLDGDLLHRVASIVQAAAGEPAAVFTAGATPNPSVRRAWEIDLPTSVHDLLGARLEALRPAIETEFGLRLGAAEGWSALRYPSGGFYRPHRDRSSASASGAPHRRAVSVVVFVNGPDDAAAPFEGGALRFYGLIDDPRAGGIGLDLIPEAGTLVAFPSDRLHEVTAVRSGERYSLVTWLERAG
jgi:predicted 2-oxoglutarate/Fe(II)-dependent dioxygenase YbiX